jgi:hypothetical protein
MARQAVGVEHRPPDDGPLVTVTTTTLLWSTHTSLDVEDSFALRIVQTSTILYRMCISASSWQAGMFFSSVVTTTSLTHLHLTQYAGRLEHVLGNRQPRGLRGKRVCSGQYNFITYLSTTKRHDEHTFAEHGDGHEATTTS